MTVFELRNKAIAEGIKSVEVAYVNKPYMLEGSIRGFQMCEDLTNPEDFEELISSRENWEESVNVLELSLEEKNIYWSHRMATLQILFVYEILKMEWGIYPISARAALQYGRLSADQ